MPHAHPGSIVHVRGEDWLVARVDAYERCSILTLDGGASRRPLRIIEPFDRARIRRRTLKRCDRRTAMRTALSAIAHARPALGLWTAADAAIDLLPYQLEPALAVLRGATRLLLADTVGLGKTIEAGLILAELRARGWVERALILCPAGLRTMWADELHRRFHMCCAVFDQATIAETTAMLPPGINPWSGHPTVIASIDLAKRDEVRTALGEVSFDILIADEAHHLTPGTDRGRAVSSIASRTPWCVLLSATPHSGDEAAFEYLAGLGGHGDALTIFRRGPQHAGRQGNRRERIVRVRASDDEVAVLRAADAYAHALWRDQGAHDPAVQLVATTIARRAASSPAALRRTLARRLSLLSGPQAPEQPLLPWEEIEASDDDIPAAMLSRPGLTDGGREHATIQALLTLLDRAASAKFGWLIRFLVRAGEPAVVFTEYRDTLEAVVAALPPSLRVLSISGADLPAARRVAIDAFNRGDGDVLVATDTAGEGLNLHYRCRLVIDMELPWNPRRLDQRVGRVDRHGQRRRVHAVRLLYAQSIEERVLDRIRERRSVSETQVARWVFEGASEPPATAWSPQSASIPAAVAEVQRLARQRWHRRSRRAGHLATDLREREAFVAVHQITHTNTLGHVVAECAVAHAVDRDAADRLDEAIGERAREQCSDINRALTPMRSAVAARLARMRARIAADRSRAIQRSLFHDRAEDTTRHTDAVLSQRDAALARRQIGIEAPVTAAGAIHTLAAAWPHRQ